MSKRKSDAATSVSALKEYELTGAQPILVDGYGRVEPDPDGYRVIFRCEMTPKQEDWFLRVGCIKVVDSALPEGSEPTRPKRPSTPSWLQMETTLDDYDDGK